MISADAFVKELELVELSAPAEAEWDIRTADLNRPGMQFCGYFEHFPFDRPQLIGRAEMTYLESLDDAQRLEVLARYFSYPIPCVIVCRNMTPPRVLLEQAAAKGIAVYQSHQITTRCVFTVVNFLTRSLAPRETRHGVLLDVYGIGVLLAGSSGVGKSEAALELVKRGHQLVADDVVSICRVTEGRLTGEAPEMVRHLMEIRGIGIIDIRAMFGVGSVSVRKSIDLVIHLEKWIDGKEYERLGLNEEYTDILGVQVPYLTMPVRPGRNLAIIIEVAARNLSLKRFGYSAAEELEDRLNEMIRNRVDPDA